MTANNNQPQLGKLLSPHEKRRDAIHIAIAPVTAAPGEELRPGDKIGFVPQGQTEYVGKVTEGIDYIGVVDPYLEEEVILGGMRFEMCMRPNTITSLRHVWTHPAYTLKIPQAVKGRIDA